MKEGEESKARKVEERKGDSPERKRRLSEEEGRDRRGEEKACRDFCLRGV